MKIVNSITDWLFHRHEKYLCKKPCIKENTWFNRYDIVKYTDHEYDKNCISTGNYLILNYRQLKIYNIYIKSLNIKPRALGL